MSFVRKTKPLDHKHYSLIIFLRVELIFVNWLNLWTEANAPYWQYLASIIAIGVAEALEGIYRDPDKSLCEPF